MKKLLCLILCLAMVIPAAVSPADTAPIPIEKATFTIVMPKAGSAIDGLPVIKLPSGANYTVETEAWSDDNFNDELPPNTVLKAGKNYSIKFLLTAKDGYEFSLSTEITPINGRINTGFKYDLLDPQSLSFVADITLPKDVKTTLKKPTPKKVTAISKKAIKVTWKKLSDAARKKIKEIEIQVSKKKNFSSGVITTTVRSSKTSATISGLKPNTRYYVRIRAQTSKSSVVYISKWSGVRKVKTKKK